MGGQRLLEFRLAHEEVEMSIGSDVVRLSMKQQGFSLIEALVAILILALGLLGTLGMIVNSLKLTSSSNYRTIAAQQAYAMAEQLRANPLALGSTTGLVSYDAPAPASDTTCLGTGGCARPAYVNMSVWMWQQQLASAVPGGTGTICRDANPVANAPSQAASGTVSNWNCSGTGEYVVKVCWNEARVSASGSSLGTGGLLCTWTGL